MTRLITHVMMLFGKSSSGLQIAGESRGWRWFGLTVVRWWGQGEIFVSSRCLYDLNFPLTRRWGMSGVEEELGGGGWVLKLLIVKQQKRNQTLEYT